MSSLSDMERRYPAMVDAVHRARLEPSDNAMYRSKATGTDTITITNA